MRAITQGCLIYEKRGVVVTGGGGRLYWAFRFGGEAVEREGVFGTDVEEVEGFGMLGNVQGGACSRKGWRRVRWRLGRGGIDGLEALEGGNV